MNEHQDLDLQQLLAVVVCPENHAPLRLAPPALLARSNTLIEQRALRNVSGTLLSDPVQALLVRADGDRAYPVQNAIAQLLVDAAILLTAEDKLLL